MIRHTVHVILENSILCKTFALCCNAQRPAIRHTDIYVVAAVRLNFFEHRSDCRIDCMLEILAGVRLAGTSCLSEFLRGCHVRSVWINNEDLCGIVRLSAAKCC